MIMRIKNLPLLFFAALSLVSADKEAKTNSPKIDYKLIVESSKKSVYIFISLAKIDEKLQKIMNLQSFYDELRVLYVEMEQIKQEIGTKEPTAEQKLRQDKNREKSTELINKMKKQSGVMQSAIRTASKRLAHRLQELSPHHLIKILCLGEGEIGGVAHSDNKQIEQLLNDEKQLYRAFLKEFKKAYNAAKKSEPEDSASKSKPEKKKEAKK